MAFCSMVVTHIGVTRGWRGGTVHTRNESDASCCPSAPQCEGDCAHLVHTYVYPRGGTATRGSVPKLRVGWKGGGCLVHLAATQEEALLARPTIGEDASQSWGS